MNKKGQTLFLSILAGVMIFAFGMIVINFMKPDVTLAEGITGMNCDDLTISDGAKVTCLGIDIVIPYLIVITISVAGGLIVSKFME